MYFLLIALSIQQIVEDCNTMTPGINLAMYYQPWCRFCQKFDPVMVGIANNAALKGVPITIQKVNCSVCDCSSVNVQGYPTTILRENGVELGRIRGAVDCEAVGGFLKKNLCENNGTLTSNQGSPIPIIAQPAPVQAPPIQVPVVQPVPIVQVPAQVVQVPVVQEPAPVVQPDTVCVAPAQQNSC